MRTPWVVSVASTEPSAGWREYAVRLRGVLDTVAERITELYRAPLEWHDGDLTIARWRDTDEIAAEILRRRNRDHGGLWEELGATGVVAGQLRGADRPIVDLLWSAGGDDRKRLKFTVTVTFDTAEPQRGQARPLAEHPVGWLVLLLSSVAASAGATQATLNCPPLGDALMDERWPPPAVDALTLVPHGVDTRLLPPMLRAYPCPVGYPDGVVVAADLVRATEEPRWLVPDMMALDELIGGTAP